MVTGMPHQTLSFTNIQNIGDVKYKTASYDKGIYYVNGGRLASAGVTLSY